MQEYNRLVQEKTAQVKKRCQEFETLAESAEGRRIIGVVQTAAPQIERNHLEFWRLASAGDLNGAATVLRDGVMPPLTQINQDADKLVAQQELVSTAAGEEARGTVSRARTTVAGAILLSILIAIAVVMIVRQINTALRKIVAELSDGAEQVASASAQVSGASQSLAQGSSEQAASLEETSSSSEEISAMARKNAEGSHRAAELVGQSQDKFTETSRSLDDAVVAMDEINLQSDKISKIIKVIDEIAFQTNILALNAAVEAARAGEAGMGFAVVADEVRNLAQRCAQAAKDTSSLIEESIAKSGRGKLKVDEVAAAIRINMQVGAEVKTLVDDVNTSSEQQAQGISQIGAAVNQMSQVTQSTAANAEESAAAAEELTAQSEGLRSIAERLTAMVGGGATAIGEVRRAVVAGGVAHRGARSGAGLRALQRAVSPRKPSDAKAPVLVMRESGDPADTD
jgi:methyl-accepting chemotaxis protein/methyl-accepting chemotaxis protein-1 (serine sensor receptor)